MTSYLIGIATVGVISSILVLGLNVRWGWAGEFDLAFYAFVAIGAYVAAVLVGPPSKGLVPAPDGWILGLHWPYLAAIPVAMLVSGIISAGLGAVALRKLRGDYFAITTVAFTYIVIYFFSQQFQLFNGFNGVYNAPQPFSSVLNLSVTGYELFLLGFCLVFLVIAYFVLRLIYRSPFGLTLRAIREDEQAAAAFGRGVYMNKLKAYFIGGLVAGLGGGFVGCLPHLLGPISLVGVRDVPALRGHLRRGPGEHERRDRGGLHHPGRHPRDNPLFPGHPR